MFFCVNINLSNIIVSVNHQVNNLDIHIIHLISCDDPPSLAAIDLKPCHDLAFQPKKR